MKPILFVGLIIGATGWAQTRIDLQAQSRNVDFSKATATKPAKTGTVLPALCGAGEMFINLNAPSGSGLYVCSSANVWSLATASSGGGNGGAATSITTLTVSTLPPQCSIGDVRFAVDAAVAGGGFYLYFCTALNTWTQFGYVGGGSGALTSNCSSLPCTVDVSYMVPLKGAANTWLGANDFSGASKTAPFRIGSVDPATCDSTSREFFFNTGSNTLKSCNALNVWTAISGGPVSGAPAIGTGGYILPFGLPAAPNIPLYAGDPAGAVVATRFIPDKSGLISQVDMSINTTLLAGKALVVGIYSGDGSTLLAYGRLIAPAAGQVTLTLSSSITLSAGTAYIQAVSAEAEPNPSGFSSIGAGGGGFLFHNTAANNRHWNCASGSSGTGTTFVLPASCAPSASSSYYAVAALILY